MSEDKTCKVRVARGPSGWPSFGECGRKIVEDGLCGIHLRAKKERERKDRLYEEARKRGNSIVQKAEELSKALGVVVGAEFYRNYTGRMVVSVEFLEKIIKEKAAGNDDKELEKRCEIAVKEVVEDSRKRRAKSSKKAGAGRGKEKGAGSSPITSLGSAPAKRGG